MAEFCLFDVLECLKLNDSGKLSSCQPELVEGVETLKPGFDKLNLTSLGLMNLDFSNLDSIKFLKDASLSM